MAIVFYPYAFSGVCTGEMAGIRDRLAEFLTFDTEVLAISCDPVYSLRAFADHDGLNFPLLSDFWPHGEVARAYDVFDEREGLRRGARRTSSTRTGSCAGRSTTRTPTAAISTSTWPAQAAGLAVSRGIRLDRRSGSELDRFGTFRKQATGFVAGCLYFYLSSRW